MPTNSSKTLYNPKDYKTNRKAVLALREKILNDTITTKDAIDMGAKKSQLNKWQKEGKLTCISWKGSNRYNTEELKKLTLKSL